MNPYDIKKISNTKIVDEYNKLNDYQKKAILNDDKTLLLNACVGSGKTTVLIQKILYLHLIKEVPLEEMVVLTFTNKAANEILERFINFNIPLTQSNLYFGTFHSIAKKLLDSLFNLRITLLKFNCFVNGFNNGFTAKIVAPKADSHRWAGLRIYLHLVQRLRG